MEKRQILTASTLPDFKIFTYPGVTVKANFFTNAKEEVVSGR
ncbi:hypothetical protein [Clostridioides difficile]|nr:hypothetical protein [Clostridioides difficile]